jgi:hypothetical protein
LNFPQTDFASHKKAIALFRKAIAYHLVRVIAFFQEQKSTYFTIPNTGTTSDSAT